MLCYGTMPRWASLSVSAFSWASLIWNCASLCLPHSLRKTRKPHAERRFGTVSFLKNGKKKRIYLWISSIAHGAKHGVVRQLLESKWMGMSPKPKRKPLNCPCSSIFDTLFQKENCSMSWGSPNCHKTHAAKMGIPWGDFLRNHGGNPGHPKLLPPERSWKIIDWWSPPSSSTTRWLTALYEYLIFW